MTFGFLNVNSPEWGEFYTHTHVDSIKGNAKMQTL